MSPNSTAETGHRVVARITTHPKSPADYSAYVPVKLGPLQTVAYVDSGNTFANVISPSTLAQLGIELDQLEPVPQLSVGTAAEGTAMKILGQAPRVDLQLGDHPAKFRIRPLVLQGLVHPLNLCGPFLARAGIDQLHSKRALLVRGKEVPMCSPAQPAALPPTIPKENVCTLQIPAPPPDTLLVPGPNIHLARAPSRGTLAPHHQRVMSLTVRPPLATGTPVLFRPSKNAPMSPAHVLQEVKADGTLSVLMENWEGTPISWDDDAKMGWLQPLSPQVGSVQDPVGEPTDDKALPIPPDEESQETTRDQFNRMPQQEQIKWLVKHFRLDESPILRRDPGLRQEVIQTLLEFSDVIAISSYGRTDLVSHAIHLEPGATPIKIRHRPLNPTMEGSLRKQIDRWLSQKVAEEADSPWSFPLVPVPKKNSAEVRWAVDYRKLNAVTKKDAFPLPNISDNLSRLSGSRVFSALDGAGAFHAVPLRRADREKTAFSTPFGQYQFIRMPFGLVNAPATYSRLVAKALRHIPSSEALCYLDDTAVHSKTTTDHLASLRKVLQAFRVAGLQISPEKAQLFRERINYLGHEVSADGIRIPRAYTAVVNDWPLPETLKSLRAFLGKCSYYRRFIEGYATLAAPLVHYTAQDHHEAIPRMGDDPAAVHAFQELKRHLLSAPVLAYPQFHGKPFILDTDFSVDPGAIGAVLSQEQDGQEKVIAYGARRLQPRERAYASTKGELLAIIFFLQYFRYYLLHRPFILRTDNRALTWIRSLEQPTGMILRWLDILASFNFKVEHRSGTRHGNADALSRAPHAPFPDEKEAKILVSDEPAVVASIPSTPGLAPEEVRRGQATDVFLADVRRWKEQAPTEEQKKLLSPDQRRWLNLLPQIQQDPSTQLWVVRRGPTTAESQDLLIIPSCLRQKTIEAAHQFLGHAGISAAYQFCRDRMFMFRMMPEIARVIQECHHCQQKDQKKPRQMDVYRSSVQAGAPFQVWSMDIVGPFRQSSTGNRYLLTLKDVFSKWLEAIPLATTTSQQVIRELQTLFARFGHPRQIHTDNATYFKSHALQEALRRADIHLTYTPTYNPQSNSVERAHRDLNTMLRVLVNQHAADWEEVLPAALLALRSAVHESTGVSPFACIYGKEPATPLDLLCRFPGTPLAADQYVRRLEAHQLQAHRAVQEHLGRAIMRTARRYGDEQDAIQPGELVWLFTSQPSADRKLAIPFTGPYKVTGQPGGTLRTIYPEGDWHKNPCSLTVSLNRLKRCHGKPSATQNMTGDLRLLEDQDEDAEGPIANAGLSHSRAVAARALNESIGDARAEPDSALAHSHATASGTTTSKVVYPAPTSHSVLITNTTQPPALPATSTSGTMTLPADSPDITSGPSNVSAAVANDLPTLPSTEPANAEAKKPTPVIESPFLAPASARPLRPRPAPIEPMSPFPTQGSFDRSVQHRAHSSIVPSTPLPGPSREDRHPNPGTTATKEVVPPPRPLGLPAQFHRHQRTQDPTSVPRDNQVKRQLSQDTNRSQDLRDLGEFAVPAGYPKKRIPDLPDRKRDRSLSSDCSRDLRPLGEFAAPGFYPKKRLPNREREHSPSSFNEERPPEHPDSSGDESMASSANSTYAYWLRQRLRPRSQLPPRD